MTNPLSAKLLKKYDKKRIDRALRLNANVNSAADMLGIHPYTLRRILKAYGIEPPGTKKIRERKEAKKGYEPHTMCQDDIDLSFDVDAYFASKGWHQ